jgi:hypothetical protein
MIEWLTRLPSAPLASERVIDGSASATGPAAACRR